ncbi:MAG: hypothetical protein EA412_12205 [Chitinophagaceae bacterium]|nr:MAG: hypothetical protein EA412_12205 [Chitinophagaceae bacterium]
MKIKLFIFILLSFNYFLVFSQNNERLPQSLDLNNFKQEKQHILKTNPFALLISQNPLTAEFRVLYERTNGLKQSYNIGASYLYANFITRYFFNEFKDTTGIDLVVNGFRVQAGYKFYLSKDQYSPTGIYVSPHASYSLAKINPRGFINDYLKVYYINANLLLGWQFFFLDKIAVDLFTGLGYRYNYIMSKDRFSTSEDFELLNNGVKFSLGINFGYPF